MELIDGDEFIKKLERFTIEVQNQVIEEAIEAGTKPVLAAMVPNTPESSGSRDKQSNATRQRWSGSRKLKDTIRAVVRKKQKFGVVNGAIGLIGPSYSDGGGHGNLFAKHHNRKVYWGRDAGGTRQVNQFVKKTADQTAAAAKAALTTSLAAGIDRAAQKTMK
jgi:hypothetical protein